MGSNMVIIMDGSLNGLCSCVEVSESDFESEFYFEDTIDSFGDSVFIGVTVLGHRDSDEVISEEGDII